MYNNRFPRPNAVVPNLFWSMTQNSKLRKPHDPQLYYLKKRSHSAFALVDIIGHILHLLTSGTQQFCSSYLRICLLALGHYDSFCLKIFISLSENVAVAFLMQVSQSEASLHSVLKEHRCSRTVGFFSWFSVPSQWKNLFHTNMW